MTIPQVEPDEVVSVGPPGHAPAGSAITATPLIRTASLDVVRLVVPAGKEASNPTAPGDATVQCLQGAVEFTAGGRTRRLAAGRLLYLAAGTLHAVRGVEDAVLLVTVGRPERGGQNGS